MTIYCAKNTEIWKAKEIEYFRLIIDRVAVLSLLVRKI